MAKKSDYRTAFGRRLRQARKDRGFTQEKLAEELNISQKHYSELERGLAGISVDTLIQVSELLDVNIDYLLKGDTGTLERSDFTIIEELYLNASEYTRKQMLVLLQIACDIDRHSK